MREGREVREGEGSERGRKWGRGKEVREGEGMGGGGK